MTREEVKKWYLEDEVQEEDTEYDYKPSKWPMRLLWLILVAVALVLAANTTG